MEFISGFCETVVPAQNAEELMSDREVNYREAATRYSSGKPWLYFRPLPRQRWRFPIARLRENRSTYGEEQVNAMLEVASEIINDLSKPTIVLARNFLRQQHFPLWPGGINIRIPPEELAQEDWRRLRNYVWQFAPALRSNRGLEHWRFTSRLRRMDLYVMQLIQANQVIDAYGPTRRWLPPLQPQGNNPVVLDH